MWFTGDLRSSETARTGNITIDSIFYKKAGKQFCKTDTEICCDPTLEILCDSMPYPFPWVPYAAFEIRTDTLYSNGDSLRVLTINRNVEYIEYWQYIAGYGLMAESFYSNHAGSTEWSKHQIRSFKVDLADTTFVDSLFMLIDQKGLSLPDYDFMTNRQKMFQVKYDFQDKRVIRNNNVLLKFPDKINNDKIIMKIYNISGKLIYSGSDKFKKSILDISSYNLLSAHRSC